ncbi:hypothetical protein ccbrp13_61950 [Ktedonobacteria bacterium brp13]|nr:hypothetical protein ccbrp13_61950 [Ktedonobacteria bacterium brp13]
MKDTQILKHKEMLWVSVERRAAHGADPSRARRCDDCFVTSHEETFIPDVPPYSTTQCSS